MQYEELSASLLASLFYPHLDFAQTQSRTESGRHIRDLIFYNNRDIDFLDEIFTEYNNRQLVIEMKNVKEISRDHINQLNRYMQNNIGNLIPISLNNISIQSFIIIWKNFHFHCTKILIPRKCISIHF